MREIRPSGSEGGVAPRRHPYPYLSETGATIGYGRVTLLGDRRMLVGAMGWRSRGIRLRSASYAGTSRGPTCARLVQRVVSPNS